MKLNAKQLTAARFHKGICSVIAIPGSGKTRTMTERIAILIREYEVPPENILGLTFTRNAAHSMRQRLLEILGDMANRVTLSTIHSFCHSLLKNEGIRFDLLYGKDQIILIKNITKELKIKDISTGMIIREISLAKNNLITPEQMSILYETDITMQKLSVIYETYEEYKRKRNIIDFDDLLEKTCELLSDNEDMKERYKDTYQHILVDEFQDTNPAQMNLIRLLTDDKHNTGSLFVVGDDWQSIYSFMGSSINNILKFKDVFPDAQEMILDINYRSTPQILKACQNLISKNIRKKDKALLTINPDGKDITVLQCEDEEDEATQIVNEIIFLRERGYQYKDIAVLYRANFQSRVIEEVMSKHKIPYHIENGLNFYGRAEVKALIDYMRFIINPNSIEGDEALKEIINVPNRYLGKTFLKELTAFAEKYSLHLYEALKVYPAIIYYIRKGIRDFLTFIEPLVMNSNNIEPSHLIYLIRTTFEYDRYIIEDDIASPDDMKIQNINQLQTSASRFKDIPSFLRHTESLCLEVETPEDSVSLMTIHKSKGLEFKAVFVTGLIEGIMPTKKGDIEEERRICFVGISRAMNELFLTYPKKYMGQIIERSIFIDEILNE